MLTPKAAGEDFSAPPDTFPNASTNPSSGTPYGEGWVSARREGFIELILRQVYLAFTNTFPGLDSAFDALKYWAETLLPAFIREPLEQLVELLVDILDSIPFIGPPLGNALEDLANLFGLMNDRTQNSQGSADTANSGVARLDAALAALTSTGTVITDNFDRTGGDLGTNWVQQYGAGVGSLGTDGNNAYWNAAGSSSRICWARHITVLTSDNQMCSMVQTVPVDASNDDPALMMILRCDVGLDNMVVASIYYNRVEIGYYLSNSYTRLGAQESVDTASGDRWAFYAGTTADTDPDGVGDERQFLLYRNDSLVCNRTDAADVTMMGASYRHVGLGMNAGVTFVPFTFLQTAPPKIQGWAAADQ